MPYPRHSRSYHHYYYHCGSNISNTITSTAAAIPSVLAPSEPSRTPEGRSSAAFGGGSGPVSSSTTTTTAPPRTTTTTTAAGEIQSGVTLPPPPPPPPPSSSSSFPPTHHTPLPPYPPIDYRPLQWPLPPIPDTGARPGLPWGSDPSFQKDRPFRRIPPIPDLTASPGSNTPPPPPPPSSSNFGNAQLRSPSFLRHLPPPQPSASSAQQPPPPNTTTTAGQSPHSHLGTGPSSPYPGSASPSVPDPPPPPPPPSSSFDSRFGSNSQQHLPPVRPREIVFGGSFLRAGVPQQTPLPPPPPAPAAAPPAPPTSQQLTPSPQPPEQHQHGGDKKRQSWKLVHSPNWRKSSSRLISEFMKTESDMSNGGESGKENVRAKVEQEEEGEESTTSPDIGNNTSSSGGGGGGGRGRQSTLTEHQRRLNHVKSEKRRRDLNKEQFEQLQRLVPQLRQTNGLNKASVLEAVGNYVLIVEDKNRKLGEMIRDIKNR